MKSIKKKLIAAILVCSLFTAVLIGVLAISNSMNTAGMQPGCDCLFCAEYCFFQRYTIQ